MPAKKKRKPDDPQVISKLTRIYVAAVKSGDRELAAEACATLRKAGIRIETIETGVKSVVPS